MDHYMSDLSDYDSDLDDFLDLEDMEDDNPNTEIARRIFRDRGSEVVEDCLNRDRACMYLVRMPCRTLRLLIVKFVNVYGYRTKGHVMSAPEQIIITLYYLAHAATMSGTSTLFGRSKNAISLVVNRMLQPLGRLFMDEMMPVDQNVTHSKFKSTAIRAAFQDCIGAIDGTHVHVYPKAEKSLKWRGRSGDATTNCLGICNHDMLFTYFFVGAQGAMHDARVLEEAESKPVYRFPKPLPGKYYLGDSGYTNRVGFLTPFRGTRYHPHEFDGHRPSNKKEIFNKQHSSIRSVIERTFGIWKNKWHIVHYTGALEGFKLRKQLAIIQATVGLHNFVRRNKLENEPEEEDTSLADLGQLDFHLPVHIDEENEAVRRVDRRMDNFRDDFANYIYGLRRV